MVRCKMMVTEKTDRTSSYGGGKLVDQIVKLSAVGGDDNKTWAKYTPGGSVELHIDNPDAFAAFRLGQCYFVDFSEAALAEADEKK